jgi:hypothetical protein
MNLSTKYQGLELKKLEEAGAAAIVYKSIFEEQIQLENLEIHQDMTDYNERNAEMTNLFQDGLYESGPEEFIMNFTAAKKALSIPLIASFMPFPKWIKEVLMDLCFSTECFSLISILKQKNTIFHIT